MPSHSAVVDSSSKTGFDDFRERKEKEKHSLTHQQQDKITTFARRSVRRRNHSKRGVLSKKFYFLHVYTSNVPYLDEWLKENKGSS